MKRKIFLTGATGTMGFETLRELSERLDRFSVTLLARPSKKNRHLLLPYERMEGIRIIWGDLMNPDDIAKGVEDADFVLHVGGMVSPAADYYPEKTFRVNTDSMRFIVDAVRRRPDADRVGVVYIGSVAQYGPHTPPDHWGHCGLPLKPALLDGYACSKIAAERILSDSGLRKWVSLRQSGILSKGMLEKAMDPITFHVPIKGVLEWVTAEDSGRLLANVCEEEVPGDFWCRFYNIGGGEAFRLTNYEFEKMVMKSLGCPPPEKVFDVRWFATRNFHGMWFSDSDLLEEKVPFRSSITPERYFSILASRMPWYYRLTPFVPSFVMKGVMRWVAGRNRLAPLYWRKHGVAERIEAHFGGMEAWNALPDWKGTDLSRPSDTPPAVIPMYDVGKTPHALDISDMRRVAARFGGVCLSQNMTLGDLNTPLEWTDADGVRFTATPASVALGGHWGPPLTGVI